MPRRRDQSADKDPIRHYQIRTAAFLARTGRKRAVVAAVTNKGKGTSTSKQPVLEIQMKTRQSTDTLEKNEPG